MSKEIERHCVEIFRDVVGVAHTVQISGWDDMKLLNASLESMEIDSLTLLDFVMKVESAYDIELDEAAVNSCRTIEDLSKLVANTKQ